MLLFPKKEGVFMKKLLAIFLAALLVASMALACAETIKIAKGSTIYLRTGAGTKYSANGVVNNGDTITVLTKGKVWTKIRTSDSREGYVKNLYIAGMGKNYADGTTYYSGSKSGKIKTKYASSTVNVRVGANKSEAVCIQLKGGTKVTVLGKNGSWYLIQTSGGTQGYVSSSYLSVGGSGGSSSTTTAKVTATAVHMRKGTSAKTGSVCILAKNTKVTVLSKANSKWWKCKWGSKTGYIYSKYLK